LLVFQRLFSEIAPGETLLARQQAAKKHEEEEEFENEITIMDDLTRMSNDGSVFVIAQQTAMISQMIRNLLYGAGNNEEVDTKIIRLPIRAMILERIIEYWHYRSQYSDYLEQFPKFGITPNRAIEMLQCADYLQT
jgi:transcription elongation factor B subunit 1